MAMTWHDRFQALGLQSSRVMKHVSFPPTKTTTIHHHCHLLFLLPPLLLPFSSFSSHFSSSFSSFSSAFLSSSSPTPPHYPTNSSWIARMIHPSLFVQGKAQRSMPFLPSCTKPPWEKPSWSRVESWGEEGWDEWTLFIYSIFLLLLPCSC